MYAIIAESGRQYKVEEGQEIQVDYREAAKGETLSFDQVLAVSGEEGIQVGRPVLEGASVEAEVIGPSKGPKLIVQKFRRRKNSRRRTGHRQLYTTVLIKSIATA